ncbi:MAG TPA: hypothetical protein VIJ66_02505 [Solirubrobacteraceae bacterium]
MQVTRDLTDRVLTIDVGTENIAHDLGLGLEDLDPGGAAIVGANATMTVGHLPERDIAGASAMQLAATVTLRDLGILILGDHALHLHQQRGLRILTKRWALQELHGDIEALKLLEDQTW